MRHFVRRASSSDLDAVFEIETNAFEAGIAAKDKTPFEDQLRFRPELFLVYCRESTVVGYVTGVYASDFDDVHLPNLAMVQYVRHGNDMLYVTSLACVPNYSGMGYRLLQDLARRIPDIQMFGVVNPEWTKMVSIHEKIGSKVVKTVPGFFKPCRRPPVDGIIYRYIPKNNKTHVL